LIPSDLRIDMAGCQRNFLQACDIKIEIMNIFLFTAI